MFVNCYIKNGKLYRNSKSKRYYSLAVFMDIKGAFDTIYPTHIREALIDKNIDIDLVNWYYDYITHRNLEHLSLIHI